ncbi:MAG: DUF58 domain-containing protein [Puniceicoccales bacterium]|jgi:uncharacterized protein (DUF58 family)|nr:DUF58 domain-containing protein [Puniceicoccales bacterium]
MNDIRQASRAASAVFRLPLRDTVWRGLHGQFAGQGAGSSLDFQDHRPYFPGDDPRHINWQAFARTGNYTMKLYRQEVSPRIDLLLDVSASMTFDPAKANRFYELAMFCTESALRLGAAVRVHTLDDTDIKLISTEALLAGRWKPEAAKSKNSGLSKGALLLAKVPLRHGSLRVLISDLLFPSEAEGLRFLAAGQGRGIVFAPWCAEEAHPQWDGNHQFEDVEKGIMERRRVTSSLLRRYTEAYVRHFETWREAARRHGVRLARINASGDFSKTLRAEALPVGAVELCQ